MPGQDAITGSEMYCMRQTEPGYAPPRCSRCLAGSRVTNTDFQVIDDPPGIMPLQMVPHEVGQKETTAGQQPHRYAPIARYRRNNRTAEPGGGAAGSRLDPIHVTHEGDNRTGALQQELQAPRNCRDYLSNPWTYWEPSRTKTK